MSMNWYYCKNRLEGRLVYIKMREWIELDGRNMGSI